MTLDLFAALAGTPRLPGARCRGKSHLFDPADHHEALVADRHRQALGLCGRCPSHALCAEWFDTLPADQRPTGVIAGRIHPPKGKTP